MSLLTVSLLPLPKVRRETKPLFNSSQGSLCYITPFLLLVVVFEDPSFSITPLPLLIFEPNSLSFSVAYRRLRGLLFRRFGRVWSQWRTRFGPSYISWFPMSRKNYTSCRGRPTVFTGSRSYLIRSSNWRVSAFISWFFAKGRGPLHIHQGI